MSLDSRSVSRWLAVAGLVLAPIALGVGSLVEPAWADDSTEYLGEVASGQTAHLTWGALWAVGGVLLLAGLIGVARLVRGGVGGALGAFGAWFMGVSMTVMGGIIVALAVFEVAMVRGGADRAEMVALYERTEEITLAMAVFGLVFFGGVGLGTLLVAAALLIRRPVPIWSPLLLVAWLATIFVSQSRIVNGLALVLLLGAFAPIAARIAGMPNEQWARWQPLPDGDSREARRAGRLQPSA